MCSKRRWENLTCPRLMFLFSFLMTAQFMSLFIACSLFNCKWNPQSNTEISKRWRNLTRFLFWFFIYWFLPLTYFVESKAWHCQSYSSFQGYCITVLQSLTCFSCGCVLNLINTQRLAQCECQVNEVIVSRSSSLMILSLMLIVSRDQKRLFEVVVMDLRTFM